VRPYNVPPPMATIKERKKKKKKEVRPFLMLYHTHTHRDMWDL
jgi:hypothetical protein